MLPWLSPTRLAQTAVITPSTPVAEYAAPIVPVDNARNVDLVSKRVGNYEYNPQWGVLLDQLWVR